MVIAHVMLLDYFVLLAFVMVLANVMVMIYTWLDDYLHVEILCIFSNKTYHHGGSLQC